MPDEEIGGVGDDAASSVVVGDDAGVVIGGSVDVGRGRYCFGDGGIGSCCCD